MVYDDDPPEPVGAVEDDRYNSFSTTNWLVGPVRLALVEEGGNALTSGRGL
jgi:hypothetical protein